MDDVPITPTPVSLTHPTEVGTFQELRESLLLLVLAAASVGAYIAVGIAAVRVFSH